jgi:hypothetical protein
MKNSIITSIALAVAVAASSYAQPTQQEPKSAAAAPLKVELVAQISQPIGNMTFTPDNRKFFSIHPFYKPKLRVAELTSPTSFKPFPNLDCLDFRYGQSLKNHPKGGWLEYQNK